MKNSLMRNSQVAMVPDTSTTMIVRTSRRLEGVILFLKREKVALGSCNHTRTTRTNIEHESETAVATWCCKRMVQVRVSGFCFVQRCQLWGFERIVPSCRLSCMLQVPCDPNFADHNRIRNIRPRWMPPQMAGFLHPSQAVP